MELKKRIKTKTLHGARCKIERGLEENSNQSLTTKDNYSKKIQKNEFVYFSKRMIKSAINKPQLKKKFLMRNLKIKEIK